MLTDPGVAVVDGTTVPILYDTPDTGITKELPFLNNFFDTNDRPAETELLFGGPQLGGGYIHPPPPLEE